jgi:hypothetical protein
MEAIAVLLLPMFGLFFVLCLFEGVAILVSAFSDMIDRS